MNILITGCSSGIGRSLAIAFADKGHKVFATARKISALDDLTGENITPLSLDVNDAGSIQAAVDAMMTKAKGLDMLVNNAGFGLMGPLVELDVAQLRLQLETNVVGAFAMVQAVVGRMIKQKSGRIVNMGSVSGVLTTPFSGAYCASKAAIHALSDAWRMELAPFGIKVITVQPGGVVSRFGDNATQILKDTFREDSAYKTVSKFVLDRAKEGQKGAMDTDEFARLVVEAVTAKSPEPVIRFGPQSTKLPLLRWLLPVGVIDKILSKRFGLNLLGKGNA